MLRMPAVATIATVLTLGGVSSSAVAAADNPGWGLNGTYTATSNGEWARKNEVFYEQTSQRSTWTITTQCSYPGECTGTVQSDGDWTAPIYQRSNVWYVKHPVANWIPCPDGGTAPGLQTFRFKAMTPEGAYADQTSTTLVGEDTTTGPSGACGASKAVYINMPFKLVKIG